MDERGAVPLWLRAMLLANRLARRVFAAWESLTDELAVAWVRPERRAAVTRYAYSRSPDYLPGGAIYEQGLFGWERNLLARPELQRRGRVLLAGAGGGRELQALRELGYEIWAFDPVERHCASCRQLLGPAPASRVVAASFDDLVRLALEGKGALEAFQGPFDLVWLGWGSFVHVTEADDQAALLRSVKSVAPAAPVVLSMLLESPPARQATQKRRLRRGLRELLPRLGGQRTAPGVQFLSWAGFTYHYTKAEFADLCRRTGYDAVLLETEPYPHALLVPG